MYCFYIRYQQFQTDLLSKFSALAFRNVYRSSYTLILKVTFVIFIILPIIGKTQETNLRPVDICPLRIKIEKDLFDCSSGSGESEKLAGKELVLITTSRITVEEINGGDTKLFQCECNYAIFKEEREVIDCETNTRIPAGDNCVKEVCAPTYFLNFLYYRWLEPSIVEGPNNCANFKNKYANRPDPTIFKSELGIFNVFIPQFARGISKPDKAVMMVCPWAESDYITYDYIKNNYQGSMDILYERAVTYETCAAVFTPNSFLFDLNPTTYVGGFETLEDIENTSTPVNLATVLSKSVNGTTADGESDVLISINGPAGGKISFESMDAKYGSIRLPWGNQTFDFSGNPFFVCIYSPPESFPDDLSKETIPPGHVFSRIGVNVDIESISGQVTEAQFNIPLIRPPIVLVHGTFDNPENCWKTPIPDEISMYQSLQEEGYYVTTVDYQDTNGDENGYCSFLSEEPINSFECNKKVVYENPGGIKDAINYFRDELNVAVTQVDVIGHSMGGVLPRVYASDDDQFPNRYNDDYYRVDNFSHGDINRLISIASTHHGSDGSEFISIFNESWKDSGLPFLTRMANGALTGLAWYAKGIGVTGAVRDQIPNSPALKRIGPTKVPSHAIVCTVKDFEDIVDNKGDPDPLFNYANLLRGVTSYFYFFPGGLNYYLINRIRKYERLPQNSQNKNLHQHPVVPINELSREEVLNSSTPKKLSKLTNKIEDGLAEFWQNWHFLQEEADGDWIDDTQTHYKLQYETAEYNHYEADDEFNNLVQARRYDIISGEIKEDDEILTTKNFAIDYIRYLIFKNDLNDCVVRYESQTGGMQEPFITHFDEQIHSFAPRYPKVVNRIKELLEGGMTDFNIEGFPAAGRKLSEAIPDPDFIKESMAKFGIETGKKSRFGCEAVCWSGMVPSHAEAFLNIAVEQDIVILGRPVNPDATPLIAADAATKGMNLKGKSANWGPHKGYIPVNQKYSKIWNIYGDDFTKRAEQVKEFSKKTKKQLKKEPNAVVKSPLMVEYCSPIKEYQVYMDTLIEDAEQSVYLVEKGAEGPIIYHWKKEEDGTCPSPSSKVDIDLSNILPLEVMSKPRPEENDTIYFTADYDLLAIGFLEEGLAGWVNDPYDIPTLDDFDNEKGFITDNQKKLLVDLNNEVRNISGYKGGDVSHHGPENQFYILDDPIEGSPYVDYPIVAFYKENGEGVTEAIPRGPEHFRDRYLKRFMAKKRREGYNLYENIHSPGWSWDRFGKYTYEKGWDDKDDPIIIDSPEEIPFPTDCSCQNLGPGETTKLTPQKTSKIKTRSLSLYPNPTTNILHLEIIDKKKVFTGITITNSVGIQTDMKNYLPDDFDDILKLDISEFPSGIYVLTVHFEDDFESHTISILK